MPVTVSLNGHHYSPEEAKISVFDRGFLFGDGVYEVARIYGGRAFLWDAHLARLRRSLDGLAITGIKIEELSKRALALIDKSQEKEATFYLQISRGVSFSRSHAFPMPTVEPTEFMFVAPFGDPNRDFRKTGARVITYPDERWGRVDIKSVNLLGNVLAAQAAKKQGALEAILISSDGKVTEGSHTNVFGVRGGALRTMPLSHAILPGVSRDFVISLAKKIGIETKEVALTKEELFTCEELFLTGTTVEIMPITEVDGKKIAGLGNLTRRLQEALKEEIRLCSEG